ncbi:MAG: Cof-type HAD-IIB family hydrolase [Gaiellales bacterium]
MRTSPSSSRRPPASNALALPDGFPTDIAAFACDLDGTLIEKGGPLGERTLSAIARSRAAGVPVILATGRMFRSLRPYAETAGIIEPVVCYQGAAVVDPVSGTFLVHERIELDVARETIAILAELGSSPNVYVDDELYVAEHTPYSKAYAEFQNLPVTEVGDLLDWLERPPTKIVSVAEPDDIPAMRARLVESLEGRLFLTRSLPFLLEMGNPSVSKGTGLQDVAARLGLALEGIVAFGDGENDIELLETSGFAFAIDGADDGLLAVADATCAGPSTEGVAGIIEAALAR